MIEIKNTKGEVIVAVKVDTLAGADLTNADLRRADLIGADLSDTDLISADLRCANLRCADLTGANLTNAKMRNAELTNANLINVNLTNAELRDADLINVNLRCADLTNASLRCANLTNANLTGADLTGAKINEDAVSQLHKAIGVIVTVNTEIQMIDIKKSATAGIKTGSQEWTELPVVTLASSTIDHIIDVKHCLAFFSERLAESGKHHDVDKISQLTDFHQDFDQWWSSHPALNRHHITTENGCPDDVNLIDVLEHIADCVSAGVARGGKEGMYKSDVPAELLKRAFDNTVTMLLEQVK